MRRSFLPLITTIVLLAGCSTADPGTEATVSSTAPPALELELITDEIAAPREVVAVRDDLLLVSDQTGRVQVLEDGVLRQQPMLDLTEAIRRPTNANPELGLAGFALAPDFASSGIFYTLTTRAPREDDAHNIRRVDTVTVWRADPATLVADPGSAVVILEVPLDGSDHVGDLAIDGDGDLWVGIGSPGPASPAQDPGELPGSLLRITPGADGYTVPADNPFTGGGGAAEVFSYGYRNPWRSSMDPQLGILVAEAMAREAYQHVWLPQPGGNAGYPLAWRQSKQCWKDGEAAPSCIELDGVPIAQPVLEYGPETGRIVSGAVVLRDEGYGSLTGLVLVSDWSGSMLLARPGEPPWPGEAVEVSPSLPQDRLLWDLSVADGVAYASTTDTALTTGELWRVTLAD